MAGLLLLTTLAALATLGSCHLADPGDSPGNYLISRKSGRQAVPCSDGKRDWTFAQFKGCFGKFVSIDSGKGIIDLSGWTDAELIEIFDEKSLSLNGGFTIKNSQITGHNVMLTMSLFHQDNMDVVIDSNPNLVDFFLEIASETKVPFVRVSGNRLLSKNSLKNLDRLRKNKHIHADSHIQVYQECDLGGQVVGDVAATLKDCKAIYGDLVFDANSKFPADMKSIEKLAYVQGCLRVTGTQFKSWNDLTFLDGTESKKGGCKGKHEISGNSQMCIQPPVAETLKENFPGMTIANNQKCTPECTSRHVLEKEDSTCVIIMDSLIIDDKTSDAGLDALENVEEIRGLLQVTNSSITDFKYLPKLTKLNSNKMSAGHVINLQYNTKMTHFDLPLLQASGVGTGQPGQLILWREKNGPDGDFAPEKAFVKRIGAENRQVGVTAAPTVAPTTETTAAPARRTGLLAHYEFNKDIYIIGGTALLILAVLFAVLIVTCLKGKWTIPYKWSSKLMGKMVEQTDIYQYSKEDEFMQQARKIVEENKPKIEAANKRHRDNQDYKKLSLLNHNATYMMPGYFQQKDYDQNKELRLAAMETIRAIEDKEEQGIKVTDEERDKLKESKKKIVYKLNLPAQMNGLYGLAFDNSIGGKYPPEVKYRTQCDLFSLDWLDDTNKKDDPRKSETDLPPIYVEPFASTAKRMCHKPCDMISENLRYLRNNSIKIPEYGITSKGFQTETGIFGNAVGTRCAEEAKNIACVKDQIAIYKFYRYREKLNELEPNSWKYKFCGKSNLHEYVIRMVEMMMSMPAGHVLKLKASDVIHFLQVILPSVIGKAKGYKKGYKRSSMSAGGYSVDLNQTHVRIVGELRGDFDALRRAINIPSLLNGKDHPMLQYNWLFLGNYTGRHPQSLETIMFLLALQFLYGRDCIVLLRGVMEFADTSLEYGFKENLEKRFFSKRKGKKDGENLWKEFMKVFARLPLNCRVHHAVYCCSGGFNDGDIEGKDEDAEHGEFKQEATLQSRTKIFSLPNYTVRDYFENVDTGAGYYYGERVLMKIAEDMQMYTFFSTGPMTGGVGYFSDTAPVQLFMLSSVKGLHGHGGMVTQLAAVAELNGKTGRVTFHMILEEDQMVYYDPLQMKLGNKPFEEEEGSPPNKKTTTTSTGASPSATPVGTKSSTASSDVTKTR